MDTFIRYQGATRAEAVALVREVVRGIVSGGSPELAETALLPGAVAILSKIQQSFIVKSRGGSDETGSWPPLKRSTIAQRRIAPGDLLAIGVKGSKIPKNRKRGLLTPGEDIKWKQIFGSRLAQFRARGLDDGEAKARAAQIAWALLKAAGAKTKLEVLGGRQVDIGRDTGAMFRSLTPGLEGPGEDPDQICEVAPGAITVGTNVPYAGRFHKRRPLWPNESLPESWNAALAAAVGRGLIRAIAQAAS